MDNFLEKPLVFLDLETTDNKIASARIAEIALIKIDENGKVESIYHKYVNPTVPMTPEAAAVTKLTDDFLKDHSTFAQQADGILEFLQGCDLAGHNIMTFDIPVLVEEFLRVGKEFPDIGIQFIDTMLLQTKIMPRTLAAVYKYFTGVDIPEDQLHGAANDAMLSAEVYSHQISRHGEVLGNTRADLHKISTYNRTIVDFAGKLRLNDKHEIVYAFGKNDGKRVTSDPSYATWMLDKGDFTRDTKRWVLHALKYNDQFYVSEKMKAKTEESVTTAPLNDMPPNYGPSPIAGLFD